MFSIDDIVSALDDARIIRKGEEKIFNSASIDSRDINGNELFFAIKNNANDGHNYIHDAIKAGARGVVVSDEIDVINENVYVIKVNNTLDALQSLAKYLRESYNPTVIGITGSVGKTTVKDMAYHILNQKFNTQKSNKSFNNEYGVPITLLNLEPKTSHLIAEIGANHIGEIDKLSKIIKPNIAVITKIGYAHIGNFGSLDNTLIAKTEIINNIADNGTLILNGDDKYLIKNLQEYKDKDINVITVGKNDFCDIRAFDIVYMKDFIEGKISYKSDVSEFKVNMIGTHNVYSVLFSVGIAVLNGISLKDACSLLESFIPSGNRLHLEKINENISIIDDSYNSSPDATISALETLQNFSEENMIAVLGDMRELGDYSKSCHEFVTESISNKIDKLILLGNEVQYIIEASKSNGFDEEKISHVNSASEAISILKDTLKELNGNTIVLIKGSRFMHMERIAIGIKGIEIKCGLLSCEKYINCSECNNIN